MFYGKVNSEAGGNGAGRGNRNERYDQMVKQQQLIEQKKMEIQARLEMERQKKEMEALSKPSSSGGCPSSNVPSTTSSLRSEPEEEQKPVVQVQNFFSNDGSFFEQFKKMQEEAAKKQKEEDEKAAASTKKIKEEPIDYDEYGTPINKKPAIKFINPDAVGRSASPGHRVSPHEISGVGGSYGSGNQPQKNYYNVPPPPPPPPPKVPNQMQQDIKPFVYGGVNKPSGFQAVPPPPPPPPPPIGGPTPKQFGWVPTPQVRALASIVAEQGDHIEEELKRKHEGDPLMWFLFKPDSTEYRTFRALVAEMKSDIKTHLYNSAPPPPPPPSLAKVKFEPPSLAKVKFEPPSQVKFEPKSEPLGFHGGEMGIKREAPSPDHDSDESESERRERKRRSRWGPQASDVPPVGVAIPPPVVAPGLMSSSVANSSIALFPPIAGRSSSPVGINLMCMPLMPVDSGSGALAKVTRTNPQLVAYAKQAYGRIDLDEDEWKQCEEAYKMNLVFQDIARKKAKNEEIEKAGKFKHEYDSDEETDGGTWEHKQRMKEMDKTREWADDLTKKAHGKHHIGDFLPPDELSKFMEKYKAVKEGKILDESEYQEYKIQQDNIGFKMLQKMGWSSGEGLGASGQGITAPIDKGNAVGDKQGLGNEKPGDLNDEDDEYTAYRKRMMLAYRFRPNPLNNPRRAYY